MSVRVTRAGVNEGLNKQQQHTMKHLRTILAAALLLIQFAASGEITFKRAPQSSRDTVYNSKYYLVCITDPGNLAAVNGEQVKVYKTGTFGRELKLQKGDNPVEVTIFQGTNVETKKFSIYYGERSGGRMDRPAPAPQLQDRLFFVETRENAYLQYGSGTDRLGGSKMGFLDPGIVLKVVGQIDNLYKVQLSANRFAYIHQEDVEMSPRSSHIVNTNNIGISNQGSRDRIRLSYGDESLICREIHGSVEFELKDKEQKMFWGFHKGTKYLVEEIDSKGLAVSVTYKVYDEDGNVKQTKTDQSASHTGTLMQQNEIISFTNAAENPVSVDIPVII